MVLLLLAMAPPPQAAGGPIPPVLRLFHGLCAADHQLP